ncbi:MAG: CAP domain-containing protein [Desulfotomaculales bacterium]
MRPKKIRKALSVLLFFLLLLSVPGAVLASDVRSCSWQSSGGGKVFFAGSGSSGGNSQPVSIYRLYYSPGGKILRIYLNGRLLQSWPGSGSPIQTPPAPQPSPQPAPQPPGGSGSESGKIQGLSADEQKMVELVNQERAKYGLAPLKVNMELVRVARLKAQDMVENNYFSHTSPTYRSPFEMMKQFGISYWTAGENLAGAPSVEVAHQSLMNSSGHRANILNPSFTQVGIGVAEGNVYGKIFVQMFIG